MLGDFIVNDNKDALLFTQIARQVGCPGVNAINVWGRLNAPRHAIAESELPISEARFSAPLRPLAPEVLTSHALTPSAAARVNADLWRVVPNDGLPRD